MLSATASGIMTFMLTQAWVGLGVGFDVGLVTDARLSSTLQGYPCTIRTNNVRASEFVGFSVGELLGAKLGLCVMHNYYFE